MKLVGYREAMRRTAILAFVSGLGFACSGAEGDFHGPEPVGSASAALSPTDPVSLAVSGSCTTAVLAGLSKQLVDALDCLAPGTMSDLAGIKGVSLGAAAFPYLQTPAQKALAAVVAARGTTLTINSALRTLPQQYLLYQWYQKGTCGIGLAASPGNSNHESGIAVDVVDEAGWKPYFQAHGWQWLGANDPVHFDYVAGGKDIRSASVLAFQKLWNANHPADAIAEDGAYGPNTEARLAKSPIGGFPKGLVCAPPTVDAGARDSGAPLPDAASPVYDAGPSVLGDAAAEMTPSGEGGCATSPASRPGAAWLLVGVGLAAALARRRAAQGSRGSATK